MASDKTTDKSLTEKIVEEFLLLVKKSPEFDASSIHKLKELSERDGLIKESSVIEIIQSTPAK